MGDPLLPCEPRDVGLLLRLLQPAIRFQSFEASSITLLFLVPKPSRWSFLIQLMNVVCFQILVYVSELYFMILMNLLYHLDQKKGSNHLFLSTKHTISHRI